ncbi:MAG: arsenate reductase ArsC [bacterium]|nr:arsenate reductase ArsC [bacterium]
MRKRVLFLCTGNSARSVMAEAIVNSRWSDAWEACSAGTRPAGQVHPLAVRALEEIGVSPEGLRPKHIDSYHGRRFDLVITVCDDAAGQCPVFPGDGVRVHVGLPDPAEAGTLDVFRRVRDQIIHELGELLKSHGGPAG